MQITLATLIVAEWHRPTCRSGAVLNLRTCVLRANDFAQRQRLTWAARHRGLLGAPYIDSTGLGLLALVCVSAREVSRDVKLVAQGAENLLDTHVTTRDLWDNSSKQQALSCRPLGDLFHGPYRRLFYHEI